MAIQKVIIPSEFLPVPKKDGKYYFRYRIKSPDGTATSAWSDIKDVQGNTASTFSYYSGAPTIKATVAPDSLSINLEWDALGGTVTKNSLFDVFVKWEYPDSSYDDADYFYVATVSSTSYFVSIPYEGGVGLKAIYGSFVIQLATQEKEINSAMEIANITSVSTTYVAPPIDGGEI
jgi:hypothetical protein